MAPAALPRAPGALPRAAELAPPPARHPRVNPGGGNGMRFKSSEVANSRNALCIKQTAAEKPEPKETQVRVFRLFLLLPTAWAGWAHCTFTCLRVSAFATPEAQERLPTAVALGVPPPHPPHPAPPPPRAPRNALQAIRPPARPSERPSARLSARPSARTPKRSALRSLQREAPRAGPRFAPPPRPPPLAPPLSPHFNPRTAPNATILRLLGGPQHAPRCALRANPWQTALVL